jgi:hypothetical protein
MMNSIKKVKDLRASGADVATGAVDEDMDAVCHSHAYLFVSVLCQSYWSCHTNPNQ